MLIIEIYKEKKIIKLSKNREMIKYVLSHFLLKFFNGINIKLFFHIFYSFNFICF